jgi:hypothetical protein
MMQHLEVGTYFQKSPHSGKTLIVERTMINSIGLFIGLAYYQGKDIVVFRFILEYSSLRDFGP